MCPLLVLPNLVFAQWVNQYPKLDDFGHHVYLEQHELPLHANGVTDPAPSPDGSYIAIASKGWIWLYNIETSMAKRLTSTPGRDSRPRWSADGAQLTFVRDFGNDTAIVIKTISTGKEFLINSPAIELDSEFSSDGLFLYYSSGKSGSLELYHYNIANGTEQKITELPQVVRNVRRASDGQSIVYLHGFRQDRVIRHRDFVSGHDKVIHAETLTYHLSTDLHPSADLMVYSAPIDNDYHLWTMDMSTPLVTHRLTNGTSFALTPAFSASGDHIYYVELTDNRQFQLMRVATYGGKPEAVIVKDWDYGESTGQLIVNIDHVGDKPKIARVSIVSASGHPVSNPDGATFVDSQTGRTYFYVDQSVSLTLPLGNYDVIAAQGPTTRLFTSKAKVKKSGSKAVNVLLTPLWDSAEHGYVSADFHVHLNGDGHQRAKHQDALLQIQGEDLNYLAPMSWNRWERRIDREMIGVSSVEGSYSVVQGQEVRSHFHGHLGLLNVKEPFAPWFFGPSNPKLGDTNLTNGDVFAFANDI